jgi:hypothetical protein
MRRFTYLELNPENLDVPHVVTMTDDEILALYFDWWQTQMREAGKADQISPEGCLEDFIAVHWAHEVPCAKT